jgi:hypothetical protein
MIDKVTATYNLYGCCKCHRRWTNYDAVTRTEGPIPKACPACRNVRWNQKYTEEESALLQELGKQHIIPDSTLPLLKSIHCNLDFVAQDFLFGIRPQPEMFELKQALAIPVTDIEQRHGYMFSVIQDRIRDKDRYEKEYFEKFSNWFYVRLKTKDIMFGEYMPTLHRHKITYRMAGCNHQDSPWIRWALWNEEDGEPKGYNIFMHRPYIKKEERNDHLDKIGNHISSP